LLASARRLAGQAKISLRVDADNLETLYLEAYGDRIVAHDRGETYFYLASTGPQSGDQTFRAWSSDVTRSAIADSPVTLIDESNGEAQAFRLVLPVVAMSIRAAVTAMSEAIDRVVEAHVVEGLRRPGWTN
jgi:hypothetical protein